MKTKFYLVASKGGGIRTTKRDVPKMSADEVCVQVELILPDKLFERPAITATLEVLEGYADPIDITPDQIENIRKSIIKGADLNLNIVIQDKNGDEKEN